MARWRLAGLAENVARRLALANSRGSSAKVTLCTVEAVAEDERVVVESAAAVVVRREAIVGEMIRLGCWTVGCSGVGGLNWTE